MLEIGIKSGGKPFTVITMEDILKSLQEKAQDEAKFKNIVHLLKVYVNNIVQNPRNAKYRKIRISNSKFHSTIWTNEDARSFLLLAGFEESDDFLVLPEGVHLDQTKAILDNMSLDNVNVSADKNTPSEPSSSSVLKLRGSADSSLFDETLKADMTLLSYMKEMGFDVVVAEQALIVTKNQGVQPAMEWINKNPGKVNEIQMKKFHQPSTTSETALQQEIGGNDHVQPVATAIETGPVSRYQTTIDERHRFQERVRLEAIEAARLEKAEQKRQKQYLLKNLEDEKKERREKGERIKSMRMQDGPVATADKAGQSHEAGETEDNECLSLRIRLPDGKITNLKLPEHCSLKEIYKHISTLSNLKEEEFVVMRVAPQVKLTEKEKSLADLGLTSQETLIVQRVDQAGTLTQGHGVFRQVLEVTSVGEWEKIQWQNRDQLVVVECVSRSYYCNSSFEDFEALNRKYGIEKQAVFVRIDFESEPAFKEIYEDIAVFPSYKLFWNKQTLCEISGPEKDQLECVIVENLHGPVSERVAERESEDYFDPR